MPIVDPNKTDPTVDGRQSQAAMRVRTGVIRGLAESDLSFLPEFALKTGRRCDLAALDRKGQILIFEIKSSIEDFRVDTKWPEYKTFCDQFYFATHPDVPADIFPVNEGLIIADHYSCEIVREAESRKLPPATRKALTLQFARSAASRLTRFSLHENGSDLMQ